MIYLIINATAPFLYHRKFYQKSKKHIEYTKRNEYTKYIHMIN